MAVDAQILNFLAKERERQSDARMKSSIFMKDTSEIMSSIKDSVRYNTTQIASLKSGLGAVTDEILSKIGNAKKDLINKISSKEVSIEKPNELIQKKSSIFMKDISEIMSSIKDSVRYNTTQIASLKNGLGAVTDEILSKIGNAKKDLINKISNKEVSIEKPNELIQKKSPIVEKDTSEIMSSKEVSIEKPDELIQKKSPIVEKLEEIRRVIQSQRDIIKRYVDTRLEGLQFEGDKTKITGDSKESDQDLASKLAIALQSNNLREIREKNAKKEGLGLGKMIAAGALLLVTEPIARIFNFFKGLGPLMRRISSGIRKISTGIRNTLKALSKSTINSIKSIGTFLRRSYLSTVKTITSLTGKIGGMFSKVGNAIGSLFGKIGGLISKIPGMSLLTKGAKFIGKKTPLISGFFEAADAVSIGAMGAEERQEYLGDITDEVSEKGFFGRMWYSLNNNVKVMSAAAQSWSDKNKLEKENVEAEKRILEMQEELARRNEAKSAKEDSEVETIKRIEDIDRTERDRIFLENLRKHEEERMRQMREQELPEAPPYPPQENNNVIINNTSINAPSSDWGQRIRQTATSK